MIVGTFRSLTLGPSRRANSGNSSLIIGATPSQNLAVKEFCFVPREKCGGFFVKFLAATFPGNSRAKICKIVRQIFAAFFARVGKIFRLNFALRKFLHN